MFRKLFFLFQLLTLASGWIVNRRTTETVTVSLKMVSSSSTQNEENPCWQDLYDDDCSMASIAAAQFVASKWIKTMPCAAGIEDCDMPQSLQTPSERPEGGVDDVDVMGFLGLKRAASLKKDEEKEP